MKGTDDYVALSLNDALRELDANNDGLTSEAAGKRTQTYGYNQITEKEENPIRKILSYFYGPMPIAIEVAAVVSALISHWADFALIVALLITNIAVTFWQERSAGNAIKQLMGKLALKARVLRNHAWMTLEARELVPGDIIRLRIGDIIPADAKLVKGGFLSVDQSALTGESMPVEKHEGNVVYSGSIVKQGEMTALVVNTGQRTYFGRTSHLVAEASNITGLSKLISKVVYFLVGLAVALGALSFYYGYVLGIPVLSDLLFFLILLVASIPIALPVVLTVTMALGALSLAERKAIVTKLVSIEELASMDVLCSDKTGTLTQNKLTVGSVVPHGSSTVDKVLLYAALASRSEDVDAIDQAVLTRYSKSESGEAYTQLDFVPFDPVRKRTEATVDLNGTKFRVTKGEPNTIISLCGKDDEIMKSVEELAVKGFRVLAVAKNEGVGWELTGLIPLHDPLREDSKETIATAEGMGIDVKMITGDNEAIAGEIGRELGLGSNVLTPADLDSAMKSHNSEALEKADMFARVYPEHKYSIVKALEMVGHTVGMTGDGVNDAPALKEAQVGIAVEGATDVARSAADIVLTTPGLSTIINAVQEGRRIFERMQSYVLYRVVETLRILVFVTATIFIFHFYPISAFLLIVLALLNDLPIIAVSTDNVQYSQKPERWRMKYIGGLSALLGSVGAGETLLLVLISLQVFHLSRLVIISLVFLKLIVSGHLTMFVTRTRNAFWKSRPSLPLFLALISTMVVGYVISAYGFGVAAVGFAFTSFVVGYSFFWFLVEDALRLFYDRTSGTSIIESNR